MEPNPSKLTVPMAIVIAGIIIAGAVMYSNRGQKTNPVNPGQAGQPSYALDKMRPIGPSDHLIGSAKAPIVIVEYSDLECPFCKDFHQTMQQVLETYGDKVAWVYRQFPLNIHPQAAQEANASECVAELGGNEKFWQYIDHIFAVTPSNNQLDLTLLPKFAVELGINETDFNACVASNRHAKVAKQDTENALAIGARGTPFSVIVTSKGREALDGAMRFTDLKALLDSKLK